MKKTLIITAAIIAVIAIAFVLYRNKTVIDKNKIVKSAFADDGVAVTTEKSIRKQMDNQLNLVGNTVPIKEVEIPAQAGGQITELHFKIGDRIGKGAVLAKIDDKMKQLAFDNAKITVSKLETDLAKIKNMYERNAASETQLREIKYAYENAKNQLDQCKKQLEYTKICAPFAGVVTKKLLEIGAFVNVGAPVCHLVDVNALKVSLNVSENDVYQLKEGKKVKITSSVYPKAEYNGVITYISPKSEKEHSYPIEVSIDNRKEYPLKSGTFVNVHISFESMRNPLIIPRQSLIGSINDAKIYVVQNGVVRLKKIVIGAEYDKYLEVVDGLNEGEEIVTSGQVNLEDKMQVRVINN